MLCNKQCKSKRTYLGHQKSIHKTLLPLGPPHAKYIPNISATPDDPKNAYCIICKKLYSDSYFYKQHVKRIHEKEGRKFEPVRGKSKINLATLPDINDSNFHCRSCDITLSRRDKYRNHIRYVHKIKLE
jgi:hypothetical protein